MPNGAAPAQTFPIGGLLAGIGGVTGLLSGLLGGGRDRGVEFAIPPGEAGAAFLDPFIPAADVRTRVQAILPQQDILRDILFAGAFQPALTPIEQSIQQLLGQRVGLDIPTGVQPAQIAGPAGPGPNVQAQLNQMLAQFQQQVQNLQAGGPIQRQAAQAQSESVLRFLSGGIPRSPRFQPKDPAGIIAMQTAQGLISQLSPQEQKFVQVFQEGGLSPEALVPSGLTSQAIAEGVDPQAIQEFRRTGILPGQQVAQGTAITGLPTSITPPPPTGSSHGGSHGGSNGGSHGGPHLGAPPQPVAPPQPGGPGQQAALEPIPGGAFGVGPAALPGGGITQIPGAVGPTFSDLIRMLTGEAFGETTEQLTARGLGLQGGLLPGLQQEAIERIATRLVPAAEQFRQADISTLLGLGGLGRQRQTQQALTALNALTGGITGLLGGFQAQFPGVSAFQRPPDPLTTAIGRFGGTAFGTGLQSILQQQQFQQLQTLLGQTGVGTSIAGFGTQG